MDKEKERKSKTGKERNTKVCFLFAFEMTFCCCSIIGNRRRIDTRNEQFHRMSGFFCDDITKKKRMAKIILHYIAFIVCNTKVLSQMKNKEEKKVKINKLENIDKLRNIEICSHFCFSRCHLYDISSSHCKQTMH